MSLRLVSRSQTKAARLRWDSRNRGTYRGTMRDLRRALLAEHSARTGKRPTGRQWRKLRKTLSRQARWGDQPEVRAIAAAVTGRAA